MMENMSREEARASQEATDWLILLQDDPDDADLRRRFDAWLAADPLHAVAWAATRRTSDMLGGIAPVHAENWQPFVAAMRAGRTEQAVPWKGGRLAGRRRAMGWRTGLGVAALAACLAFVLLPSAMPHLRADHITGSAEMRTVTLDDGSTVVLAPDSAITIAYDGRERRVDLLAGEAFFVVAHGQDRPFRVWTGPVRTTDIGTAFAVRRDEMGAQVAVQQGSVRVDDDTVSPPISQNLREGQSVRVSWSGAIIRGDEPATQVAAWRQGQLIALDQPMREVVDRLRPYFRGTIVLAPSAPAERSVTGVYNLTNPVEALRGIARAQGATVSRITPWILVVSGG